MLKVVYDLPNTNSLQKSPTQSPKPYAKAPSNPLISTGPFFPGASEQREKGHVGNQDVDFHQFPSVAHAYVGFICCSTEKKPMSQHVAVGQPCEADDSNLPHSWDCFQWLVFTQKRQGTTTSTVTKSWFMLAAALRKSVLMSSCGSKLGHAKREKKKKKKRICGFPVTKIQWFSLLIPLPGTVPCYFSILVT